MKDPFEEMSFDEQQTDQNSIHSKNTESTSEKIEPKNSVPKDLFAKFIRIGIPIGVILVLIWMFMPNQHNRPTQEQEQITVDEKKQSNETSAILSQLKLNLEKQEPKNEPQPLPIPVINEKQNGELNTEKTRQEEIRASALEVNGQIKLITDIANSLFSAKQTEKVIDEPKQESLLDQTKHFSKLFEEQKNEGEQNNNEQFLNRATQQKHSLVYPENSVEKFVVQEGSIIRTILLSSINSDLPGKVTAVVSEDVYDSRTGHSVLIPKGSKIIGVYNTHIIVGQKRLMLAMQRLILPDGSSMNLSGAVGADLQARAGLDADVDNHFWQMFSSSFILGAASLMLPDQQNTISTSNINGNGDLQAGTVAALAMAESLNVMLERNKRISPTLTVKSGERFSFLVAADLVMKPYRRYKQEKR